MQSIEDQEALRSYARSNRTIREQLRIDNRNVNCTGLNRAEGARLRCLRGNTNPNFWPKVASCPECLTIYSRGLFEARALTIHLLPLFEARTYNALSLNLLSRKRLKLHVQIFLNLRV